MSAALTLAGVRHRSRASSRRLLRLLRRERPAAVLVEMSRASLDYRRGPGRAWRRELRRRLEETDPATGRAREARELLGILALPPELVSAVRYARERAESGAPRPRVVLADRSRWALPKLEELDAWAAESAGRLDRGIEPQPFPERRGAPRPPSPEERAELDLREDHAERAIRRALGRSSDARAVYVCGVDHLAPLAARLSDLGPRVRDLSGRCAT